MSVEQEERKRSKKVYLINGIPRPCYYWSRLRDSIRATIDAIKRSDTEDRIVSHGVHFLRDVVHRCSLLCILYNSITREYLTVDAEYINVYHSDGRRKDVVKPATPVQRLVHASQVNLYVAWTPQQKTIFLMTPNLDVISEVFTDFNIVSLVYNQSNGDVVVTGAGVVSMWTFRFGARHLVPRVSTTSGLNAQDQFSQLLLEDASQPTQKCFGVCGAAVAVFDVGHCKLTSYHRHLHPRTITSALFFNPLKYLITGAKDGCIKVWLATDFTLQHVFIGHTGRVTAMACYPFGAYFLSAATDSTLRVWSLDLKDQVDMRVTDEPIEGMGTVIGQECFYSYRHNVMKLWKINQLYYEHTTIGQSVLDIKHTSHPMFARRAVLACRDSSVRIVCPDNGDVITTLLMPVERQIVDTVYDRETDSLFTIFANGDLVKASAKTNPCTVVAEWPCSSKNKQSNCLLLYEYIVNMWGAETRQADTTPVNAHDKYAKKRKNKTLLLSGRKDGFICVFNMDTGDMEFKIEAHGRKGVHKMVANPKYDQIISAGQDNIIRIWRVYPYAHEALAPMMSFFCAHLAVRMVLLNTRLAVAFEDHGTATYSVIVHDLETKERFDHNTSDDHTDSISGLDSCQQLKIFASSSYDGTIRIWSIVNDLLRVLVLHATPFSVGFRSPRGDLAVGIHDHLHIINHKKFLPRALLFRMVCMKFAAPRSEPSLPWDDVAVSQLSKADVLRLKLARSTFRYETFADPVTEDEGDEDLAEQRSKTKALALLQEREVELMTLRDGKLPVKPKRVTTEQTRTEAFDNYLKIFHDRPKVKLPKETKSIDDQMKEIADGPPKPISDDYRPDMYAGFFHPSSTAAKSSVLGSIKPLEAPYRFRPDGYVPNSVLARLLWPPSVLLEETEYKPPMMTDEQMALIAKLNEALNKKMTDSDLSIEGSSVSGDRVMLFDDEMTGKVADEERVPSSFLLKLQGVLDKPPTPEPEPEPETSEGMRTASGHLLTPHKPLKKLISRGPSPEPRIRSPPPRISVIGPERDVPSTPPHEKVLPMFIQQFIGQEWFDKYFPNCSEKTMPRPWTLDAFITMLLRVLRTADVHHKIGAVEALKALHVQEGLPNTHLVRTVLLGVLNSEDHLSVYRNEYERKFLASSLSLVVALNIMDKVTYSLLMVTYLDGDSELRHHIKDIFSFCGLRDEQGVFYKELESWDIWSLDEKNARKELGHMCDQWLDKWLSAFKLHLQDVIDTLKRGESMHGKVGGKGATKQNAKGILKKGLGDPLAEASSITVTLDSPPDKSTIDGATYLEAINYFVEMSKTKAKRKSKVVIEPQDDFITTSGPKNTVVVLPRIAKESRLLRLGETHTSHCHPERETSLQVDYRQMARTSRGMPPLPGHLHGFTPAIVYPMKSIDMNPFTDVDCPPSEPEPVFITLRLAPKYFIPEHSVIPSPAARYSVTTRS